MLAIDKDGWINNSKIELQHCSSIEHSSIGKINAIVLHRTGSTNAQQVLNAWKAKKEGTHFLISESGKIYQTASLRKQCWHVGKLYAKCRTVSSCSEEDTKAIDEIVKNKKLSWGKRYKFVTRHELKKNYPSRFPHNHDSLGIEIVGLISKNEVYETPNELQLKSLFWLLDELVLAYTLSVTDLYAHGEIAHKDRKKTEGSSSLKAYTIWTSTQESTAEEKL